MTTWDCTFELPLSVSKELDTDFLGQVVMMFVRMGSPLLHKEVTIQWKSTIIKNPFVEYVSVQHGFS